MALDFSELLLVPNFNLYARPCTFYAITQGGGTYTQRADKPSFHLRCIYATQAIDIIGQDGQVRAEQKTWIDIREREWPLLPEQRDRVFIPADGNLPELGMFEIL